MDRKVPPFRSALDGWVLGISLCSQREDLPALASANSCTRSTALFKSRRTIEKHRLAEDEQEEGDGGSCGDAHECIGESRRTNHRLTGPAHHILELSIGVCNIQCLRHPRLRIRRALWVLTWSHLAYSQWAPAVPIRHEIYIACADEGEKRTKGFERSTVRPSADRTCSSSGPHCRIRGCRCPCTRQSRPCSAGRSPWRRPGSC